MRADSTDGSRKGRLAGVRSNEAGRETRERLLDAAERLFAQKGIDAVSVRDITEAAGANTASIHYHFGSKVDLVSAILERRGGALGSRRDMLLDELDQQPEIQLRSVVEVMVLPTAEMAAGSEGGRCYIAFLTALGSHPELMPVLTNLLDTYTERFLHTLARVTPELSDQTRLLRFAVAKDLVNRILGEPEGQIRLWIKSRSPGADEHIIDSVVDMLVGMFSGPESEPHLDERLKQSGP